jgi:two-component sensor histidine kinase
MATSAEALAILMAMPEPAMLATAGGCVLHANRAAARALGGDVVGIDLIALCEDPGPLGTLLERASGSREPLPGSLIPRDGAGLAHHRVHASLVTPATSDEPAVLLVRLSPVDDRRFAALSDKIRELHGEIRRRERTQAVLEESLRERDLLLRELHHRVKNNMQMLAGMLASARREVSSPEAGDILEDASRRLVAVGTVQQMLYGSCSLSGVRTDEFLPAIVAAIVQSSGRMIEPAIKADAAELANDIAVPVALILNELLTNAMKHGSREGADPVLSVTLRVSGDEYLLIVGDDGPGYDLQETRKRASGLGLVIGLVRQLGGSLAVERAGGARVTVRFRDRSRSDPSDAAS